MRSIESRRRTVRLAVMTVSLAVLAAACSRQPTPAPTEPDGDAVLGGTGGIELTEGTLLISDGTERVRIGDAIVTFPGPVTDAVWSPDGSRIAYVDGDGNIATARPDGTDVLVLTKPDPSVVRSRPTWSRQWIIFAEKKADGTSALRSISPNTCSIAEVEDPQTARDWPMDTGEGTSFVDLAPSSSTSRSPLRLAFQHDEPSGPEIWVNDSNQRVPVTYKVVDGSEPALTLDGQKLAYVGRDGDVYVTVPGEAAPAGTRVTVRAGHPKHLAWSPDGQHIAYATADAVVQVSATGGANAPTTLAATAGVPAYLQGSENALFVVTAADATGLSIAASQARWPAVTAFFLAQGYTGAFEAAIALAEQPTAGRPTQGPLLLVSSPDQLDSSVIDELRRIFGTVTSNAPDGARPLVLVGEGISRAVDDQLRDLGYEVSRRPSRPTSYSDDLCAPQNGRPLFEQRLVVVDGNDPGAVAIAEAFANPGPMLRLAGALTDEQITWLRHSSGVIESVYVIGSVPEDVQQQIAELVAGPLGFTTTHNPVAPPLSTARLS